MAGDELNPLASHQDQARVSAARLDNLLERLCDQLASDEEVAELDVLLVADPLAREYYLRYIALHSSLQNGAGSVLEFASGDCGECEAEVIPVRSPRLRSMGWALAVAATLAAVLVGVAAYRSGPLEARLVDAGGSGGARATRELPPVARVTRLSDNATWEDPNQSIALRSHVRAGQMLRLARGEIRLTYDTGVELRLLAPAEFVVGSGGGRLRRGGVRAVVPERGRGFTIETPNGKVVDLGTEFGVAVDDFGVSEVSVFQGIVDMFPVLGGIDAKTIRLTKGEAVQWNSETFVRLRADPLQFGDRAQLATNEGDDDARAIIDEDFGQRGLKVDDWRTLGNIATIDGALELRGTGATTEVPYLITAREFVPTDGPITVVCDIRFADVGPGSMPSFAVLTRSADERDADAPEGWRTMHTCVRCSFKSPDASSTGVVEAATKLDRRCPLTNILWRGFDHLERNVPYRLVMVDDGINVAFTVSLRDDPSINKTVTCRSLFRGKENFIAFEGPVAGSVAVDRIQVYQNTSAELTAAGEADSSGEVAVPIREESLIRQLDALAPADASLVVQDDFNGDTLDANLWTTLDDVALIDGRVRLGKPNAEEHINTWTSRPYLLTRRSFTPAEGALTIVGTAEFEKNFLSEYGGSFAVMTRADNRHGSGPGWEYSILRYGVRANFWPAAWGQEHSLEIHEKPSPSTLSLLVAEGLEINPEAREYLFKIVDDGERVTLTIQDAHDAAIQKTVSVPTNPALRSGFIGFEGCWGCPMWLDNLRIYRASQAAQH